MADHDIVDDVMIAAPPDRVWTWTVEDPSREQQWRNLDGSGVQRLERLDGDGPVEVGSVFRGWVKVGPGKPQAYTNEVTALEPGRRIAWRTTDADGPLLGYGAYELEAVEGGTHFTIRLAYPPRNLLGRIQRPIVRAVARRTFIPRMLAKLKRLVEAEAAGGD